jgi:hypothetical protein
MNKRAWSSCENHSRIFRGTQKRGMSTIVTTVLVILITVVAVMIIWIMVIPIVRDSFVFSELDGRVTILYSGGYTVYDADKEVAVVQIKRDSGEGEMKYVNVIFDFEDGSVGSLVLAPGPGRTEVYTFGLKVYGRPLSVRAAPVFVSGMHEKEGVPTSNVKMKEGSIRDPGNVYYLGEDDLYGPKSGIASWWCLNGDAQDCFGDADGEENKTVNVDYDDAERGKVGYFEGSDVGGHIKLAASNTLLDNEPWTMSAWFNPSSINSGDTENRILTFHRKAEVGTAASLLVGNSDEVLFRYYNAAGSSFSKSFGSVGINSWHHIIISFDGSSYRVLWDGNYEGFEDTFLGFGSHEAFIGGYESGSANFHGMIDDVMIYDRALSKEEMEGIYDSQSS